MNNRVIKTIVYAAIFIVLFVVAMKVIGIALRLLLPIAVVVVIAYGIYMLISKKR